VRGLALPSVARGRGGAVRVRAHGTTGTRDFGLPSYAARFAAVGLAVLVFDYRDFGGSAGEPRQLIDVDRQLEDLTAAVSFARALPDVDGDRVALRGTSLGAGHVVSVAAGDPTIAAAVAQLPFMGVDPHHKSPRPATVTLKLFARAVRDVAGARLGRPAARTLRRPSFGATQEATSPLTAATCSSGWWPTSRLPHRTPAATFDRVELTGELGGRPGRVRGAAGSIR
jgi:dienelactone hydrolase